MPSLVREKSYGSVRVFWLDRERALSLTLDAGRRLLAADEAVLKVGVFGSIARGCAVPGSDVDLLILLKDSYVRPLNRPALYLPYFEGIGLPVELFCFTEEEADKSTFFARNAREARWLER